MEKVKTSISLDKDVLEFIQKLAENQRTNVSQIINKSFYDQLKKEQEKEKEKD